MVLLAWLGPLLAGCGVPGPDGPPDSYGLDFSLPNEVATPAAVVFFIDGVSGAVFEDMLEKGELPAIERYFVDRGLYSPMAVAGTPSVTLANMTSVVTGLMPGHHGVTGNNWFDRNQLVWRDYEEVDQKNAVDGDYIAPNLYEAFPDQATFSVFFQPHRGATKFIEDRMSAAPPFVLGWYEFVDRLTLRRFNIVMRIAREQRRFPAVTIAYLLAPDFLAYRNGASSQAYREAIRHTDRQIGRVLGDMERAGRLDKTVIALVSDHSQGDVARHFPIGRFLRDQIGLDLAPRHLREKRPF
jgi:predicted AlkP superfamily pyrophosphatase or phosphodiesterase